MRKVTLVSKNATKRENIHLEPVALRSTSYANQARCLYFVFGPTANNQQRLNIPYEQAVNMPERVIGNNAFPYISDQIMLKADSKKIPTYDGKNYLIL